MDVPKERRCVPRVRAIGELSVGFTWAQVSLRLLSMVYTLGALSFVAWLYVYWRPQPHTRVDILVPSFVPVTVGVLTDGGEVVSLLFFNRKRAVHPVTVCFDVALIGVGIFCFLVLSMIDRGTGIRREYWAHDMTNAMIFMIVFCIIHSAFIVLAAGGVIHVYLKGDRSERESMNATGKESC